MEGVLHADRDAGAGERGRCHLVGRPSAPASMPFGFIGRVSPAPSLRAALDASAARSRGIADRVTGSLQWMQGLSVVLAIVGVYVVLGHLVAILASDRVRPS